MPETSMSSSSSSSSVGASPSPPPDAENKEVFESIYKGRKSWKTTKSGEMVWPPNLEAALIEGASTGHVGRRHTDPALRRLRS